MKRKEKEKESNVDYSKPVRSPTYTKRDHLPSHVSFS